MTSWYNDSQLIKDDSDRDNLDADLTCEKCDGEMGIKFIGGNQYDKCSACSWIVAT